MAAFPAPTGVKAGKARFVLPLRWEPVTLDGQPADFYTVAAYGLDGNRYAHLTVGGTSCLLQGLKPGWTYKIQVQANGGDHSPAFTEIIVSV